MACDSWGFVAFIIIRMMICLVLNHCGCGALCTMTPPSIITFIDGSFFIELDFRRSGRRRLNIFSFTENKHAPPSSNSTNLFDFYFRYLKHPAYYSCSLWRLSINQIIGVCCAYKNITAWLDSKSTTRLVASGTNFANLLSPLPHTPHT